MSKSRVNPKVMRQMVDARRRNPYAIPESPSIITGYFRDINKLVRQMAALVKERIYPILDQYAVRPAQTASGQRGLQVTDDDFGLALNAAFAGLEKEFEDLNRYAARVATNRLTQANRAHRKAFLKSWSATVGVDVTPLLSPSVMIGGRLIDRDSVGPVSSAVTTNVELIKTVPKKHLAGIQKAIMDGIANGDDSYSLKKMVAKVNGQDTRRAKLIARDQLQKLNGSLNQARQQSIGVNGYVWRTSHDERVRQTHKDNDGKKFQWDAPPRGTGHPGEDIQCRCVAEPDLSQIVPWLAPTLKPDAKKKRRVPVGSLATAVKPKPAPRPKRVSKKQRIEKAENEIVGNKFETGIAFDNKGNEVFRKKGGKRSVSFSRAEVEKLEGTTFTHNHPGDYNLSPDDFNMFSLAQMKEMRAVSTEYVYSIKGSISREDKGFFYQDVKRLWRKIQNEYKEWFNVEWKKGNRPTEKQKHKAHNEINHKHYSAYFNQYEKLTYTRTKR